MSTSDAQTNATQSGGVSILWRMIPAIVLISFGLLFAALGGVSCWGVWLMGYGVLSIYWAACLCLTFAGVAWILAACAFIRAKWLRGWIGMLIGLLLYGIGVTAQYIAFLPGGNVDASQQAASMAGPIGPNAVSILETALSAARLQDKHLLIRVGAPSCGPCRRLEEFFNSTEKLFDDDYVVVAIDVANMVGGLAVEDHLRHERQEGGIPWMVILDANGKELISSDGPKGNIGYPTTPEEICHFITMIEKTRKRMSAQQVAAISQLLQENVAKHKRK